MQTLEIDTRHRLRKATQPLHERIDGLFGSLDLALRQDYAHFLRAHLAALETIEKHLAASPLPPRIAALKRPDLRGELKTDLAELGEASFRPAPTVIPARSPLHAAGLIYVIAGSRLGAQVLLARLREAGDAALPARYLEDRSAFEYWRSFVDAMNRLEPDEEEYMDLQSGAETGFLLFQKTFQTTRLPHDTDQ